MSTTSDIKTTGQVLPAGSSTVYAVGVGPVLPLAGGALTDSAGAPNGAVKYALSLVSTGGLSTTPIAAGVAANTVIKASAGQLCRVLVTATGTAAMSIFDNATTNSGTIIGALPANPTVGAVYDFNLPAANGITVGGSLNNPGVTISFI